MSRIAISAVGLVMIGGYNVKSEDTYEGSVEYQNVVERTDGADDDNPIWRDVGIQRGEASFVGVFNDATGKNNDMLKAGIGGGARAGMFGVDSIGGRFFGMLVEQVNYERRMTLGELTKAAASYHGTAAAAGEGGADQDGRVVHAHTQETGASGDTESNSVDNSAASTSGGAGYLEVSELTLGGYTSVTVKLRHSTDDVVYSDLATFTAVTAAPDSERKQITGTINRYVASSYVFNGSGSGQSVTFAAGVVRNE